jgi:hypothetical protein
MTPEASQTRPVTLSWPVFLMVAGLGLVILFTLLEPEPSRPLELPARLAFWCLQVGGLLGLMQLVQYGLSRIVATRRLPFWTQILIAGLAGTALFAPLGVFLDDLFGLEAVLDEGDLSLPHRIFGDFVNIAPPAVFAWLGLNAARNLSFPVSGVRGGSAPGPVPAVADPTPPSSSVRPPEAGEVLFWSRTPPTLGRDLVALTAELHYLRVETSAGNALILYPFGQAVAELTACGWEGSQIHRSHWVAHAHVSELRRRDGQVFCILDTGARLPVGRRRQAEVIARLGVD